MRSYGALNPIDGNPMPPDTVQTLLLTAASAQAMDWAGSTVGSTEFQAHLVRFTGMSSQLSSAVSSPFEFMVNLISTHVIVPTSGTSITTGTTAGSTGNSIPVLGCRTFQIPQFSTGFSVMAIGSGYVLAEIWRK